MVEFQRLTEHPPHLPHDRVTLKLIGNFREIKRYERKPSAPVTRKLSKDLYYSTRTGEVLEYQHTENRSEGIENLRKSMKMLREMINTNVTKADRCLWVTLTYKENMGNPDQLYHDFRKFNQRLRYYLDEQKIGRPEYIATAEPQERGAWHMHIIYIFPSKKPFIPNDKMAEIWKLGFTNTKALRDGDDVGAYLTAYLTNIAVSKLNEHKRYLGSVEGRTLSQQDKQLLESPDAAMRIRTTLVANQKGMPQPKAFVKGGRLHLYPTGFRLFRCSRGIKRPAIIQACESFAQDFIGDEYCLKHEQTVQMLMDSKPFNIINTRTYKKTKPLSTAPPIS